MGSENEFRLKVNVDLDHQPPTLGTGQDIHLGMSALEEDGAPVIDLFISGSGYLDSLEELAEIFELTAETLREGVAPDAR